MLPLKNGSIAMYKKVFLSHNFYIHKCINQTTLINLPVKESIIRPCTFISPGING